jgi:predicted nucleic acid-binding protein
VPITVVQETAYLAGVRMGPPAEAEFLHLAAREYTVELLEQTDLARAADLVEAYADFPLGFVDASIIAVAERLDITTLLTTDRRHFGVVRPAHCPRLRLAP